MSSDERLASVWVENVSVSFPIYATAGRSLRNEFMKVTVGGRLRALRSSRTIVDALHDISFTLEHGDRVALIGHNGAGKTTLLRVLAGIYAPVSGRIEVNGRIAPLFDTSFGMESDATGLENIRLRGIYLGLNRAEMDSKIQEIMEFCELGSFLEMPLRTYSAGMITRLAFAISTSIDPEILLLDEQIGAGDADFMRKAVQRLEALIARSGVLVLASHSASALRQFCNKGIVLDHGRLAFLGSIDEAIDFYHQR